MRVLTNCDYITEKEAAQHLGVSVAWLRAARYSRRPDGPPFYRFGGAVRYRVSELEEWAASRRVTGSVAQ